MENKIACLMKIWQNRKNKHVLAEMQCPHSEARVHLCTRDAGVMEKLLICPGPDEPAFTKHVLPKQPVKKASGGISTTSKPDLFLCKQSYTKQISLTNIFK